MQLLINIPAKSASTLKMRPGHFVKYEKMITTCDWIKRYFTKFYQPKLIILFRQIQEYANRIANYFYNEGYRKGDKIALLMDNRPEYIATWLGLSKVCFLVFFLKIRESGIIRFRNAFNARLVFFFEIGWSYCIPHQYKLKTRVTQACTRGFTS